MTRRNRHVLRYRRYESSQGDDWKPIGSSWQTPASGELVAHDVYHHLPGDTGTFAEEAATFGAEYYINFEDSPLQQTALPGLNALQRGAIAVVANGAKSAKNLSQAFSMPTNRRKPLSAEAEEVFAHVAHAAYEELAYAFELRMCPADIEGEEEAEVTEVCPEEVVFVTSFVNLMRHGYRQARRRFPDQLRVRSAMDNLEAVLRHLSRQEVPDGHIITLTLSGYDCKVEYPGADVEALESVRYVPALLMSWSGQKAGWGSEGISLHRTEAAFADYLEDWENNVFEGEGVAEQTLPDGSARQLVPVYVTEVTLIQKLDRYDSVRLLPGSIPQVDVTPSGRQVIGGLG